MDNDFIEGLETMDKIWRVIKTTFWIFVGVIVVIVTTACGTDHTVKGGTESTAKGTLEVIKKCDRAAINICKEAAAEDKLECVKYACEISGSVEILGMSDENIGDILDAIDKEEP
jgi:hypothetical protein